MAALARRDASNEAGCHVADCYEVDMTAEGNGRFDERVRRPATLTQTVVEHIRHAIVAGEYVPGQALPEVRLASGLGTSRGTVREALRALADDGLVDVLPHRGTFVSTVTVKKASEVYDLRALLEPAAVRLGVESGALLEPAYAALIHAALARLEEAVNQGDALECTEAERDLHRLLWSASGNELMTDILGMLHLQTRRMLAFVRIFEHQHSASEVELHEELVREILAGDPRRAERTVAAHLRVSRELLLPRISELIAQPRG
jgi:DNA-binding GntR family transcriptional regulator